MHHLLQQIVDHPVPSLLVVGNLVLIESLLSVDNAAVLATMVMDLSRRERVKALRYGIVGAYIFRGLCLLFASFLVKIWWLKPIGGLYLLFLFYQWIKQKIQSGTLQAEHNTDKKNNRLYNRVTQFVGNFWGTVILVELMDLAFSIDNVFAAVAFSRNILLIWLGVFIGILAMRFVAQGFVTLMGKYPFLETCAYLVIGILGIRLSSSIYQHYYSGTGLSIFLDSPLSDYMMSALTISIFVVPMLIIQLLNKIKKPA